MSIGRIDTHQHIIPRFYADAMDEHGATAGGWPEPDWSPDEAIGMMDDESIATGILSVSSPGAHLGTDAEGRSLARRLNEYCAELVKDHPTRFGHFAAVPLPDVDGSLAEIAYAFDELGCDGVGLMTNADGRYLGDPAFEPVWAELDRRAAVVFIHPTAPPMKMLEQLPSPLLDFTFDTTRTAVHMVVNGVVRRHPRTRVILAHAGGFLPFEAYRFMIASRFTPGMSGEDIMTDLKSFYIETALSSTPLSLPAMLDFAGGSHVVFGCDFPYATHQVGHSFTQMLDDFALTEDQRSAIMRGNMEKLFPRLAALPSLV